MVAEESKYVNAGQDLMDSQTSFLIWGRVPLTNTASTDFQIMTGTMSQATVDGQLVRNNREISAVTV
jgi:hypothetical protein